MQDKRYRAAATPGESAGRYGYARQSHDSRSRATRPNYGGGRTSTPHNNRGGSAPMRPMPRRRRHNPANVVALIVVLLALLAGIVYVGSAWFIAAINNSTYCSNIYVNGISLSSYTKDEGIQYVRDQLDARLNTVYSLSWGDNTWTFSAADFGGSIDVEPILERVWNIGHVGNFLERSASIRSLSSNPINLSAPLVYDEQAIDTFLEPIAQQLYIEPHNAEVGADLSNPYLASEASSGQELDMDAARLQIISLIETGEGGSVLPVNELEPDFSTEMAANSLELIVDYQTDTTARGYNGRFNVRKALMYFYGMIVHPGEEISFNNVVGPRTEERGWQLGTEYLGGGKTQQGYGGGVCQASTTLYGALLKAGMTIMYRSPHSMTVAYVDPSLDAAVTAPGEYDKDLVFRNDTDSPITIYCEVTKEYARVMIYGKRPAYRYELESIIVQQDKEASRIGYIEDTEGTHCYYADEYELYKKGIPACRSQGFLVGYDWNTGEEVTRLHLSNDSYGSGTDIYWRGIHLRDGSAFVTGEEADGI